MIRTVGFNVYQIEIYKAIQIIFVYLTITFKKPSCHIYKRVIFKEQSLVILYFVIVFTNCNYSKNFPGVSYENYQ